MNMDCLWRRLGIEPSHSPARTAVETEARMGRILEEAATCRDGLVDQKIVPFGYSMDRTSCSLDLLWCAISRPLRLP